MANKMLIDATHPEETRVVVLRGNRVEEFDFETAHRKQLRGNIYLAKVTRVEPSLQAAFVDYGGNRHGFLAFSEIHPDYYQIPVADRQALLEEDARSHADEDEDEHRSRGGGRRRGRGRNRHREARQHRPDDEAVRSDAPAPMDAGDEHPEKEPAGELTPAAQTAAPSDEMEFRGNADAVVERAHAPEPIGETANPPVPAEIGAVNPMAQATVDSAADSEPRTDSIAPEANGDAAPADVASAEVRAESTHEAESENGHDDSDEEEEVVDTVGGADAMEEVMERAPRYRRQYKIQEVIKRRQVMLVQVVKEERGTKGAALTTYLSLAGRYSVLMPNTARGGGISRKITSSDDRKKLREIADELEVPEGMGVILRTAGANRTKAEVKRDFEYLLRLWETVRDLTLKSSAPTLVYEEGSLAKRSIRDLYTKDIEEIVVAGEAGYRDSKEFMRMLMPSHAKNVKLYKDTQPVFTRYGIESQLDAMFSPTVQLKSGGYIVINQTEALVSIDVNSGRSTREHHIEDTALKTNAEAAEEIARQLRLRDLAGLIVIDFIDMDEKRNNRSVERRLKDALRNDRARIQVGRISHFGLLEMSRQRIRTSVLESSTEKCAHCGGTGHTRSVSSVALQLLRSLEETLLKGATHNQIVRTRPDVALYVLNHKRAHLAALEQRFRVSITIDADATLEGGVSFALDRGEQVMTLEQARAIAAETSAAAPAIEEEPEDAVPTDEFADEEEAAETAGDAEAEAGTADGETAGEDAAERDGGRRRRRRRRGRGRNGDNRERTPFDPSATGGETVAEHTVAHLGDDAPGDGDADDADASHGGNGGGAHGSGEGRRRRRGRRGGRRNRRDRDPAHAAESGNGSSAEWQPQAGEHSDDTSAEAPSRRSEPQPEPQPEPQDIVSATPAPATMAPEPPAPAAAEPPRRRSTVREPAPVFAHSDPSAPAPVVPAPAPAEIAPQPAAAAEDNGDRPRRTGWWSRKLLGGDKG